MSREIYASMTAASASLDKINEIANNLSNMSTVAFKSKQSVFENHMASQGYLGASFVKLSEPKVDMSNGTIMQDNVDTHFALQGDGYFVLESTNGELLLSRGGNFQLDGDGTLVNDYGEQVMGLNGPINFSRDETFFSVTQNGAIIDDQGAELNRFMIADGTDLTPLNGSRWMSDNINQLNSGYQVIQGSIETSNVEPFRVMLDLIQTSRGFETYQKTMLASSEMDKQLNQTSRSS
jgi:flagellar basal body rod protein FlgG